jgi:carboxyl-terminal processing protease
MKSFPATLPILIALLIVAIPLLHAQDDDKSILQGLARITDMLDVLNSNYFEEVETATLIDDAIRGMLGQLDPHSSYISPDQLMQLQSQQQGEYYGVGMTVGLRDGVMYCVSPHEGGPAATAGLRAGDTILAIDGKRTDEHEYTENVERLRGPRGTTVTITVSRPGIEKELTFTVIRDRITLKSVAYAFMIDESTGYIRINNFSHTTDKELREELLKLQRRGMRQILLDLRSNPGGDLDASVGVANLFLDSGKIVYTRGKTGENLLEYSADEETTLFRGPMVVLINSSSASGSEVVAGALQDHDRAWIVGEKSWGKGLVQTQYPLEYGALLSLTTAKYYTPSGRLIQKPYTPGNFELYYNPDENQEISENLDAAMTDLGRVVYGGDGIMPDQLIPSTIASRLVQEVMARGLVFDFVNQQMSLNPTISDDYYADTADMQQFRDFLKEKEVEYDDIAWKKDYDFLAARVTLETHSRGLGPQHGFKLVNHSDDQLQRALQAFKQARDLLARRLTELSSDKVVSKE